MSDKYLSLLCAVTGWGSADVDTLDGWLKTAENCDENFVLSEELIFSEIWSINYVLDVCLGAIMTQVEKIFGEEFINPYETKWHCNCIDTGFDCDAFRGVSQNMEWSEVLEQVAQNIWGDDLDTKDWTILKDGKLYDFGGDYEDLVKFMKGEIELEEVKEKENE